MDLFDDSSMQNPNLSIKILLCIAFQKSYNSSYYRQVSNIRRTSVGNKIVDNSDVVGASPTGAAPTTSSLST